MESARYNVLLNYDPENQEIHQKVMTCLSRLDPTVLKRLEKVNLNGRLIVKRDADLATARRLEQILRDTGALCCVQKLKLQPLPTAEQAPLSGSRLASTQQGTDPLLTACPNCGYQQPPGTECRTCGIIFSKFRIRRKAAQNDAPAIGKNPPKGHHTSRILNKVRQSAPAVVALLEKIQHPLRADKLTGWARRVADRVIRCGIVFFIALFLQIGLLSVGKMLWFLYVSTPMGQYYLEKLPEKTEMLLRIVNADPLILGWDTTLAALFVGLFLGCVAQVMHLIRYLYESQGFVGKLALWIVPSMAITAWVITRQHPYPDYALAGTLAALPILCMLSSCLYLAQTVLPEIGDLRKIIALIHKNREKTWGQIIKKIRIWLDSSKKVY